MHVCFGCSCVAAAAITSQCVMTNVSRGCQNQFAETSIFVNYLGCYDASQYFGGEESSFKNIDLIRSYVISKRAATVWHQQCDIVVLVRCSNSAVRRTDMYYTEFISLASAKFG